MLNIITKNETLVVDSRLIAQELGIEHRALMQTIKKYLDRLERKSPVTFEEEKIKLPQGGTYISIRCLLNEEQAQTIISKSRNGLSPEAIEKFRLLGFDFSMFPYTEKRRSKKKESDYCKDLAKSLNGKREVSTIAGNIDILTSKEVIEVKEVKMWKHALGQVLVYGSYYPSHQKRIHLYGETQESYLEMVKSHCNKFNIKVTWEA